MKGNVMWFKKRRLSVLWIMTVVLSGFTGAWGISVTSFTEDNDGITCRCNEGIMKVKICTDDIVRVAYTRENTIPERSLKIVTAQWQTPQFTTSDAGNVITMETGRIKVKVNKTNANVTFTDMADNVILSEYSKTLSPATVEGVSTHNMKCEWNSPADEGLYGLGQHQQGKVNYKGQTEFLDQRYPEATAVSVLVSTKGYGIFWDNYSFTEFAGNIAGNTRYSLTSRASDVNGSILDYYFFYGPEIDQVIAGYRTATGHAPLFPKWAYGLVQSRDRYESQDEIYSIKDGYRNNNIPLDCIVQDWHYWDGAPGGYQGCYCWNPAYGDYKETMKTLHGANIHTMISIWSQLERGSPPFNTFNDNGWLWPTTDPNCGEYTLFLDAYNTEAREAFWELIRDAMFDTSAIGFDAWWLDNDEPFPHPCGLDRNAVNTAMGKGALFYNSYTFPMSKMGYDNWRRDIPGKRFVMLHRANFAGQQAHSTMQWSNDILSNFDVLKKQVPCGLNSTICGIPYWCSDIGGYWGPGYAGVDFSTTTNQELMVRWLQYGAFCPVFRIHGKVQRGQGKELFSTTFSAENRAHFLVADKLHYRLMPYIYSMAWMTTSQHYTPMRHLVFDFRTDPEVKDIGDQYMYGPAIMVCPVTTEGQRSRQVYLPDGVWYNFWTGERHDGGSRITVDAPLSLIPLFVRGGSILPMGPEIQYANERSDTIELRIYPGEDDTFTIYEDEGDNYNYEEGVYATIPISYTDNPRNVTIGERAGTFPGMDEQKVFNIVYVSENHGTGGEITATPDTQIVYTGVPTSVVPGLRPGAKRAMLPVNATVRAAGNIVALSGAFTGKEKTIAIYNCAGKLLQKAVVRKNVFNLRKDFKLPAGVYIVKADTRIAR